MFGLSLCSRKQHERFAESLRAVKWAIRAAQRLSTRSWALVRLCGRTYSKPSAAPIKFLSTQLLTLSQTRHTAAIISTSQHPFCGAQVLSLWMWLSLRLGEEAFPGHARAVEAASSMVELMDLGLQALSQRQVTRRTRSRCRHGQATSLLASNMAI